MAEINICDPDDYAALEAYVRDYIERFCIIRGDMPGKAKGSRYAWMFYLRNGLFNPDFLRATSQMMLHKLVDHLGTADFQVCGAETAGTPLAVGIPFAARMKGLRINGFVARKERKQYGLMNFHEGIANEKPVVLVDDLCNSSTSLAVADAICRQAISLPSAETAIVIVNKSNRRIHTSARLAGDLYLPPSVKVLSLFTLDDFGLSNPSH
ncbi:MAG: hypothetical protein LCH39_01925 [Proteobacteria bacterium]|nr:hypothetical protein [Pseudomonadota bacterium]